MATQFKAIGNNDVTKTKTLIHEAIPVTGTLVSGTYVKPHMLAWAAKETLRTILTECSNLFMTTRTLVLPQIIFST